MTCRNRACAHEAKGDFYVNVEECIVCGAPEHVAPEVIAMTQDADIHQNHCFFKKQPSTPEEIERAVTAMDASCVEALRYRGRDPEVLRRLEALGLSRLCDHPRPWWRRLLSRLKLAR